MLFYLILLFTVVPLVELLLLIKLGQYIGAMRTIFIVVATGIFGAVLARTEGMITLRKIQIDLHHGVMPTEGLIDGVIILIGGLLLITPGILTDMVGFIFVIPFTRTFVKSYLKHRFQLFLKNARMIHISDYDGRYEEW